MSDALLDRPDDETTDTVTDEWAGGDGQELAREYAYLEQDFVPMTSLFSMTDELRDLYLNRIGNTKGNAAEVFHLNSSLSERSLRHLPDEKKQNEIREWRFMTPGVIGDKYRYDPTDERANGSPWHLHEALPQEFQAVLQVFGEDGQLVSLLYSLDLMLVLGNEVYRQPPGVNEIVFERRTTVDGLELLNSVCNFEIPEGWQLAALAIVVGVPWRNMVLMGTRGYRRTLIDTGVLLTNFAGLCGQVKMQAQPITEFADQTVDRELANDGLERSALALCPILMADPDNKPSSRNGETPQ